MKRLKRCWAGPGWGDATNDAECLNEINHKYNWQTYHRFFSWTLLAASTGQRWWRQTHSALHLSGWVRVQPFSSPLVSLLFLLLLWVVLLSHFCCPCSGRKECRSSRASRTPWRSWEPCRRRRRSSRSPKRDLPLSPCWRWSGGSWSLATRSRSFWRIEFVTHYWRAIQMLLWINLYIFKGWSPHSPLIMDWSGPESMSL